MGRLTLLPCPFCGGVADFRGELIHKFQIECGNCRVRGESYVYSHAAVEAWNRRQSLESVRSEALLAQFGNWVLEELRGENIGNDLDGGAAQDKAEELGLLVRVHVTEPCGERCECAEYGDFPQMCLRRALSPARVAEGIANVALPIFSNERRVRNGFRNPERRKDKS